MKKQSGGQPENKNAAKAPEKRRIPRSFKANEEEYNIIKENAANAGMGISEFIRKRTMVK